MQELTCPKCSKVFGFIPLSRPTEQDANMHVCADCWNEWKEMQTKVINEYKLDFSQKEHRDFIRTQMKAFLKLNSTQ